MISLKKLQKRVYCAIFYLYYLCKWYTKVNTCSGSISYVFPVQENDDNLLVAHLLI